MDKETISQLLGGKIKVFNRSTKKLHVGIFVQPMSPLAVHNIALLTKSDNDNPYLLPIDVEKAKYMKGMKTLHVDNLGIETSFILPRNKQFALESLEKNNLIYFDIAKYEQEMEKLEEKKLDYYDFETYERELRKS